MCRWADRGRNACTERGDKRAARATDKDYGVVETGSIGEYTQREITLSGDGAQCLCRALNADVECWFAKADCRDPLRWWERGWDSFVPRRYWTFSVVGWGQGAGECSAGVSAPFLDCWKPFPGS